MRMLKATLRGWLEGYKLVFLLFLLAFALRVAFVPMDAHMGSDSFWHYLVGLSAAQGSLQDPVFANVWHYPENPLFRSPGFAVLISIIFRLVGDSQIAVQMFCAFIGALVVVPTYYLAKHLFSERTAFWSALIAANNPYMILMSAETLPRMLVTLVVLSAAYVVLRHNRGSDKWFYGFVALLLFGCFMHTSAVAFFIPLILLIGWESKDKMARAGIFLMFALLVIGAGSSSLMWLTNIEQYHALQQPTLGSYLQQYDSLQAVGVRLFNMVSSYVPPPQKALEYGLNWTLSFPIIGLVTPLLFIFSLAGAVRYRKSPIVWILLVATAVAVVPMGYPSSNGLSMTALSPAVPLLIILGVAFIQKKDNLLWLVFILTMLQAVYLLSEYPTSVDSRIIQWGEANVQPGDVIMSRNSYFLAYSLRGTHGVTYMTTPFGTTQDELIRFVETYNVSYYIFDKAELDARNWDTEQFNVTYCGEAYCAAKWNRPKAPTVAAECSVVGSTESNQSKVNDV
jgi:4-amino-4-deoxy-L-arabinose transferase-like glycosyltransferase